MNVRYTFVGLIFGLMAMTTNVSAAQPNIVFILIDDLGARDLSGFGSTFYETPVLDQLAESGVRFENAYASSPICSPTRASILTGKYPARTGLTQWIGGQAQGKLLDVPYVKHLRPEETTLAEALHDGGYQTWHVGKWHLGEEEKYWPEHNGFDVNVAGSGKGQPPGPAGYWSPYSLPNFTSNVPGEYLTDRLTDECIRLIRARDVKRPFFLNLWHYAVHMPAQAPETLIEKYRLKAKRLGLDRQNAFEWGDTIPIQRTNPERIKRRVVQSDPVYAAMVENLDTNVGRLIAELKASQLLENTLLVFTSDNGGLATAEGSPTSNLPFAEGKGWCYEGGNRVCQFICWPAKLSGGRTVKAPVTSTDFYPTLLEAAALPLRPAQHVDGISLMPLLLGANTVQRDAIFWHYPHYSNQGGTPAAAVVSGNWKLIEFFEDKRFELFDLSTDVGERHDLSSKFPQEVDRLRTLLETWQRDLQAKIPEPNPTWRSVENTQ